MYSDSADTWQDLAQDVEHFVREQKRRGTLPHISVALQKYAQLLGARHNVVASEEILRLL